MPDLSIPDLTNYLPDLGAILAGVIGFLAAFSLSLGTRAIGVLKFAAKPFSGLWLHLRLMAASKALYETLYAVVADEIERSMKKGEDLPHSALAAITYLKRFEAGLEAPEAKPKPRRSRKSKRRIATPAEGAVEIVKPAERTDGARVTTPAQGAASEAPATA